MATSKISGNGTGFGCGVYLKAGRIELTGNANTKNRRILVDTAIGSNGALSIPSRDWEGVVEGHDWIERQSLTTKHRERLRSLAHATLLPNVARDLHLRILRVGGRLQYRVADRARTPPDASRLRVLAVTSKYPPRDHGGAEVTLHSVMRRLSQRGHETRVLVTEGPPRSRVLDGIAVEVSPGDTGARDLYRWADVVFGTHLGRGYVLRDAARWGRPVAYYMQLGRVPRHRLYGVPELTVFNSRFLQREYAWMRGGMLLHPPIDEADYLITRGDAITLVNPLDSKGGQLVFDLATRIPGRQFLTVRNWGAEPLPACPPPNVTVLETQADMRVVYARTRILLVASSYESYGRVGLEAAVSGIPTIAHDLAALRESLADAAIWIGPGADPDEWIARINELDDPASYAQWSARARRRFEELDPECELDQLERALVRLATNGRRSARSLPARRGSPSWRTARPLRRWRPTTQPPARETRQGRRYRRDRYG